ncbi:MAG TPA: hypothetical protein VIV40_43625, partial [Kofleriaceae bacterium]
RDLGWPALTDGERITVVASVLRGDPAKSQLRLSFIDKAASSTDDTLLSWITGYLVRIDPYVPLTLRPSYNAWIAKLFAARVRAFGIAPRDVRRDKLDQMQSLLFIVMRAGDPGLRADAIALLPKLETLDAPARALVLRAAMADKPSYADDLAAEIPHAKHERMSDIAFALETVPDLLDFMTKHLAEVRVLPQHDKLRLYNRLCDATRRADVEALGRQLFDKWNELMLRDYEWCIQERKALEPELRAFLSNAPIAAKPSDARR